MLSKRWQDKNGNGIFAHAWIKNGMRSPSEAAIDMVTDFKLVISALENTVTAILVNANTFFVRVILKSAHVAI